MKRSLIILLTFLCVASLLQAAPKREMRSAWIATVANIDWPSKNAIGNPQAQKQEMIHILDSVAALKMNMVIFQVRPTADALYASKLEPWSHWLTGKQGEWKGEKYDPLEFVCAEAHKRCIDVHVWLNPYRVTTNFGISELAKTHIYQEHKNWFVKYGKQWYFNPGLDETRQWLCGVAADIVERYDVDGLHFDDYFYPYKVQGEEFPDAATFKAHPRGFTNKDAWRRNNVDMVIQELHDTIKAIKPWVEFGISPFGVWRNIATDPVRGSNTKAGVQNYDDLYADILLWLEKGWIDYVVPQLYWEIGKTVADYKILAEWWAKYSYGRNLYIGHAVNHVGNSKIEAWMRPNEICRQVALNRSIPEIQGSVYFPVNTLLKNRLGLCDSLLTDYYAYPAIPPMVQYESIPCSTAPDNLRLQPYKDANGKVSAIKQTLQWDAVEGAGRYVVYAFPTYGKADFDDPQFILAITADNQLVINIDPEEFTICVTAVNRYHSESLPTVL